MSTHVLRQEHWRKSSQWFVLNRRHAAAVTGDADVAPIFAKECWVDTENYLARRRQFRMCVSDEHYLPTLLAARGACCPLLLTACWGDLA